MFAAEPLPPPYALVTPIQIGSVAATTVAVSVDAVVFEASVAFAVGGAIEFSLVLETGGLEVDCLARVTSCDPAAEGYFRATANIERFHIVRERPAQD